MPSLKNLKVGDTLISVRPPQYHGGKITITEAIVTKVGRDWLYTGNPSINFRYHRETGRAEGYCAPTGYVSLEQYETLTALADRCRGIERMMRFDAPPRWDLLDEDELATLTQILAKLHTRRID